MKSRLFRWHGTGRVIPAGFRFGVLLCFSVVIILFNIKDPQRLAYGAETVPKSHTTSETPVLPVGPQPQLEGQHSEYGEQPSVDSLKAIGATVLGDIAYLVTVPLRMDLESGLIIAGVVGAVGGVMAFDSNIQKWVQKNQTQSGSDFFN